MTLSPQQQEEHCNAPARDSKKDLASATVDLVIRCAATRVLGEREEERERGRERGALYWIVAFVSSIPGPQIAPPHLPATRTAAPLLHYI